MHACLIKLAHDSLSVDRNCDTHKAVMLGVTGACMFRRSSTKRSHALLPIDSLIAVAAAPPVYVQQVLQEWMELNMLLFHPLRC